MIEFLKCIYNILIFLKIPNTSTSTFNKNNTLQRKTTAESNRVDVAGGFALGRCPGGRHASAKRNSTVGDC
jgi:hypothetical protein